MPKAERTKIAQSKLARGDLDPKVALILNSPLKEYTYGPVRDYLRAHSPECRRLNSKRLRSKANFVLRRIEKLKTGQSSLSGRHEINELEQPAVNEQPIINTQGRPDRATLEAQLVQMQAVVPRGELRSEYEDLNAVARHCKTLLNRLSFKPNPVFTWVSAEGTTWSTNKLKQDSTRRLAIILWKEGVIRLLKEPVNNYPNTESQTAATPTTAEASANANNSHNVSESQAPVASAPVGPSISPNSQNFFKSEAPAAAAAAPVVQSGSAGNPPSDDFNPFPSLADIEAESTPASLSKRKGKQPVLPSKTLKNEGDQDIIQFFNRIPSSFPTAPSSSNANTRMTLRSGKVADKYLQQPTAAAGDVVATAASDDEYMPSPNADEDEEYIPSTSSST